MGWTRLRPGRDPGWPRRGRAARPGRRPSGTPAARARHQGSGGSGSRRSRARPRAGARSGARLGAPRMCDDGAGRGPERRFLAWCWLDISRGDTIDLWVLVAASLIFTVLGFTGIASIQVLSSGVLGLLALLAVSQLNGRQEDRSLVASWQRSRTSIFESDFPDAYCAARSRAAQTYSFAGMNNAAHILDHATRPYSHPGQHRNCTNPPPGSQQSSTYRRRSTDALLMVQLYQVPPHGGAGTDLCPYPLRPRVVYPLLQ